MGTEDLESNVVPITVSSSTHGGAEPTDSQTEPLLDEPGEAGRGGDDDAEIEPGAAPDPADHRRTEASTLPPTEATQAWLDAEALLEQVVRVALGVISKTIDVLVEALEGSGPPLGRHDVREPGTDTGDVPAATPGTIPLVTGAALGLGLEAGRWVADSVSALAKMAAPFASFAASPRVVRSSARVVRASLSTYNDSWGHQRPRAESAASAFAGALVPEIAASVLDQLDLTQIVLDRVDIDRVVARVDLDAIVARIDVDGIVDRVDLDEVASRIDLEAIIARIDVTGIAVEVIEEIDLSEIIRESSGALAGETVEGLRIQGMNADRIVGRVVDRVLLRRQGRELGTRDTGDSEPDPDGPTDSNPAGSPRTRGDRP